MNNYDSLPDISWVNIWEENDVLAMPLKRKGIRDIEFKGKNIFMRWNPSAHLLYLRSRKFADLVKEII